MDDVDDQMKESKLDRSSELRRMQREQERERRRIRDRQRRQSMIIEQRERHLARRRKNYQLRRLGAENAKVDDQQVTLPEYSNYLEAPASNLNVKRLRLSHVRCLARTGNRLESVVIADHRIVGETDANNASLDFHLGDFDSSRLPNGISLRRVKQLARTINKASGQRKPEEKTGTVPLVLKS